MKTCEITCSDGGKNMTDGREHYWLCGRPAKYVCGRKAAHERRSKYMCGIHANAERKIAERHGFKSPTPL
jgi:nitrate reductase beta subunit